MSGCRIGKVKPKSGGEIYRLPTADRDSLQRDLVRSAATVSGLYKSGELFGYVVIGWAKDGSYSLGFHLDPAGVVGPTMLPSYVADAIRRDLISGGDWSGN